MILLIDNYDSFSYNLFQLIGQVNSDIQVFRNDKITIEEIDDLNPEAIILSPGPGKPEDAGICIDLVKEFHDKIPILGVCLGHQSICAAFGGEISHAKRLMHGKSSDISLDYDFIFKGLPNEITVGRYHSLSLLEDTLPEELKIISKLQQRSNHKNRKRGLGRGVRCGSSPNLSVRQSRQPTIARHAW